MRIVEPFIALTISAILHLGLMMLAPGSVDSLELAAPAALNEPFATIERVVIVAHLKNTLDSAEQIDRSLKYDETGRTTRASAIARKPRLDNARRFYPPEAIARGLEGETILMLTYRDDGTLLDAKVAKSSGHAILDDAALRAVRAAPSAGPGPREMLFPVTFALQ